MQKRLILVTIKSHSITIKPPSNHNKSHYFWFLAVLIIHSKKNIKSSLNIRKSSLKSSLIHEITIRSPWTHQEISIKHTKPPVFSHETTISSSRGCHRAASHPSKDLALELRQDLVQQHSGQYQAGGPGVAVARARPEPRRQQRETTGTVKKNMGILKKVDFHGKKAKLKLYLGVMVTFSMVTWGLW